MNEPNEPKEPARALIFSADRELEFLSDVSDALRDAPSEQEIYRILGSALHLVVGEQAIVNISNYDKGSPLYHPQIILGLSSIMDLVLQVLGRRPEELAGDYPAAAKAAMRTGRLSRLEGGVVGLAGEALSPLLCSTASAMLGIHDVWVLGYTRGSLSGGVSIISRVPDLKLRTTLIEAIVRQAAGALERKRIEDALRLSEERFRTLVSMVGDVIWRCELDARGRAVEVFISPVVDRLLGLPEGTIDNDPERCLARIHPEDAARVRGLLAGDVTNAGVQTSGGEFSFEFRFLRPDGAPCPVRVHGLRHARAGGGSVLTGITSRTDGSVTIR